MDARARVGWKKWRQGFNGGLIGFARFRLAKGVFRLSIL